MTWHPQSRARVLPARTLARIVGASLAMHASLLFAATCIEVDAPVEARAWVAQSAPDEHVFVLDLRTTPWLAIEPVAEPELDPGAPSDDAGEVPAPEAVLETVETAAPAESPLELADVVPETVPVSTPEVVPEPEPPVGDAMPTAESPTPAVPETSSSAAVAVPTRARPQPSALGGWLARSGAWSVAARSALSSGANGAGVAPVPRPAPTASGQDGAAFAPRLVEAPKPVYPDACRRSRVEGSVLCRMHVGRDGAVTIVDVVETSGDERLDQCAVRALGRWRFDPVRRQGTPVESRVLHRVSFRLQGTSRR